MQPPPFILTITQGPSEGKAFTLQKDAVKIGRLSATNDLVLNNQSVSQHHACIHFSDGAFFVKDAGSRNGTYLDGKRLAGDESVRLEDDAELCFGSICLKFARSAAGESREKENPTEPSDASESAVDKTIVRKIDSREIYRKVRLSEAKKILPGRIKERPVFLVGIGVALFFFGLIVVKSLISTSSSPPAHGPTNASPANAAAGPLNLPFQKAVGFLPEEKIHSRKDKAAFQFLIRPGGMYLNYTPGFINTVSEVSISLNNHLIGYAPLAPNGWGKSQVIHLPKNLINHHQTNMIVFDNTLNPSKDDTWGLTDLYIENKTEKACNHAEAKRLFELGENAYEEKSISTGNLFHAVNYYSDALVYLDNCLPLPPLYSEVAEHLYGMKAELREVYKNYMFLYKKAQRLNNTDRQVGVLENILRLIPDEHDPRHKMAAKALEALNR